MVKVVYKPPIIVKVKPVGDWLVKLSNSFEFLKKYLDKPINKNILENINADLKSNGYENLEAVIDNDNKNRIDIIKKEKNE